MSEFQHDVLHAFVEFIPRIFLLFFQRVDDVGVRVGFPLEQAVDLVQGDHKRCFTFFEQLDGLQRLRLQPVHDVHDQDGDIT